MTCSTSSSLVEHVGEIILRHAQAGGWSEASHVTACSRAAVRAILEYARAHVTKDMILAARRVKHLRVPKRSSEEVMFVAMIDAAIGEMEK
jgi:hypothetical protein